MEHRIKAKDYCAKGPRFELYSLNFAHFLNGQVLPILMTNLETDENETSGEQSMKYIYVVFYVVNHVVFYVVSCETRLGHETTNYRLYAVFFFPRTYKIACSMGGKRYSHV